MIFFRNKISLHPYNGLPFILLSGVGRSGTTVLRKSLGMHPEIIYNGQENNIIHDLLACGLKNCTLESRKRAMLVNQSDYNAYFKQLILNLLYPKPKKISKGNVLAFSNLTPELANYFLELFPKGKVIYLVRNGIEVVSSRMIYKGFRNNPFISHLKKWEMTKSIVEWGKLNPMNFFLILHENLLNSDTAQVTLNQLWKFLSISQSDLPLQNLLNRCYHPSLLIEESVDHQEKLKYRKYRWKTWTLEQQKLFLQCCTEAMTFFNYPLPETFETTN